MRIRLLGTGTPTPSLKRMSAGYLVETGDRKVLFDFGPGAYHRMLEAGIRPVEITDIFFTHLHYDHCLDYVRLLMTRWDQGAGRIPELRVYGPAYTARMTEADHRRRRAVRARPRRAHRVAHEPGRLRRTRRHAAAPEARAPSCASSRAATSSTAAAFGCRCAPCFMRSPISSASATASRPTAGASPIPATRVRARRWSSSRTNATCSCTCATSSAARRSAPT